MRRTQMGILVVMSALFITMPIIPYCFADGTEAGDIRYQIFPVQTFSVLLDTKTGKIWKINADMTGKMKAEGISVEGLAYSNTDLDSLNNKIKDIDFESVSDKFKKECKEKIVTDFSYGSLDSDKINKILHSYAK